MNKQGVWKIMKALLGTFLVIVCAVIGAYLAVLGAALAGLPKSDWSLEPLLYLALGLGVGAVGFLGAVCLLSLKPHIAWMLRMLVATVAALFLAFLSGFIGYPILKQIADANSKKSAAESRASNQRYMQFYSKLHQDPEILLRESWYKTTDERRLAYRMSIQNQDVNYSPSILTQLYFLDDEISMSLLSHPSFEPLLLENEFRKELKRSKRGGHACDKLQAILRNPNARDDWFAEVILSGIIERNIFLCSDTLRVLVEQHQIDQQSEHASNAQPVTRPAVESESNKNPQPETEEHSR